MRGHGGKMATVIACTGKTVGRKSGVCKEFCDRVSFILASSYDNNHVVHVECADYIGVGDPFTADVLVLERSTKRCVAVAAITLTSDLQIMLDRLRQ
jgi:triosephosphate isomerase